jgi:beta-lactamase regulating signal transducer with metallopeptidase domain
VRARRRKRNDAFDSNAEWLVGRLGGVGGACWLAVSERLGGDPWNRVAGPTLARTAAIRIADGGSDQVCHAASVLVADGIVRPPVLDSVVKTSAVSANGVRAEAATDAATGPLSQSVQIAARLEFPPTPGLAQFGTTATASPVIPVRSSPRLEWSALLMLAHVTGAFMIVVWIGRQWWLLHRLSRTAKTLRAGPIYEEFLEVARVMGVRRPPSLFVTERLTSPIAFGLLGHVVLISIAVAERLSRPALRTVLAHELGHFRRRDLWVNALELCLLALWWFHPLLWLLHRTIRKVREDCCDDLLLARQVTSGDAYCDVLLSAARTLSKHSMNPVALGFGDYLDCGDRSSQENPAISQLVIRA